MSRRHAAHDATGIVITNDVGHILLAYGTTVPSDTEEGYATGCLFQHTDGGDATSLYVNEGDEDSANFNAVTVGA